ncbi:MAG: NUDIX domain-containing protein [Clostridia bacterium]|nr:NUDIX domain-containing protein [Clostridia bacterium]
MFCTECGEKLSLVYAPGEGLVPYCKNCGEFRHPQYGVSVSLVVTNRAKDKILMARHVGQEDYILFAGHVKKGEVPEKTVTREFKEETKLDTVKYKYMMSKYNEDKNMLLLNFLVMAEDGNIVIDEKELSDVQWMTFDEALGAVQKDSYAQTFLKNALGEIKKF